MFWLAAAGQLRPRAAEHSIHTPGGGGVKPLFFAAYFFCFSANDILVFTLYVPA